MKKYYTWINIARGIGMILVVIGHAADDTWIRSASNNELAKYAIDFIYSFHMPLFFFISGFCSTKILKLTKMSDRGNYLLSRFKRLMIPYLFVGILYIPLKLLFSGEVTAKVDWGTLFLGFLNGNNPNGQLWTLYALFLLAVLFTLLNVLGKRGMIVIALALTIVSVFYDFKTSIIQRSTYQCFFYMAGILFNEFWIKHGEKIFNRKKSIVITIGMFALLFGLNIVKNVSGYDPIKFFTAVAGILCVCFLAVAVQDRKCRILNLIGKYSMDIYIIANVFQVLSRSVFLNRLHLPLIVCFLISLILGLVMPVVLSKFIIRKVRILRMLILGDFSKMEDKHNAE